MTLLIKHEELVFFSKNICSVTLSLLFFFAYKLLGGTNYQKDHNENIQHKCGGLIIIIRQYKGSMKDNHQYL